MKVKRTILLLLYLAFAAVIPLPQLTVERATELVVEHLVNRARSRKSRLKDLGYKHSLPCTKCDIVEVT
jgi:hypothetical protein